MSQPAKWCEGCSPDNCSGCLDCDPERPCVCCDNGKPEKPFYAPGSDTAIEEGCTCPVLDNGHGKGYMGQEGIYIYSEGCPVHWDEVKPVNR